MDSYQTNQFYFICFYEILYGNVFISDYGNYAISLSSQSFIEHIIKTQILYKIHSLYFLIN